MTSVKNVIAKKSEALNFAHVSDIMFYYSISDVT